MITYVSYLCHQLLLLRKEGRAAVVIQTAWKKHRKQLHTVARRMRQHKATVAIQVQIIHTLSLRTVVNVVAYILELLSLGHNKTCVLQQSGFVCACMYGGSRVEKSVYIQ